LMELNDGVNMIHYSLDAMRTEFNESISNLVRCLSDDNRKLREELNDLQTQQVIRELYEENKKLEDNTVEIQVLKRSLDTFLEERRIQNGNRGSTTTPGYNMLYDVPTHDLESNGVTKLLSNAEVRCDNDYKTKDYSKELLTLTDITDGHNEFICGTSMKEEVMNTNINEDHSKESEYNVSTEGDILSDTRTSHLYQKISHIRTLLMRRKEEITSQILIDDCVCVNVFEKTSTKNW